MAIYTITTDVNIDTLAAKAGNDTYNINGTAARLIIDEHSRYGLNSNTSAILGNVTPSASLGGTVTIDGSAIWLIPFNTGSGTIPAYNTVISLGGASGKLIGVTTAINAAPGTVGAAMPASGYIMVKQWNGTNYGTGALTGISASAIAGEKYGFIVVVGQDAGTMQPSRLNQVFGGVAQPLIRGQWFEVGTTDGTRATTYQLPTDGSTNTYFGGVFVDAAASIAVTGATWSAGVATFTVTAHGLVSGQTAIIEGVSPSGYNGTHVITVLTANTFTVPITSDPGIYSSGGTCSNVEFYQNVSSAALDTVVGTDALRGKVCYITTAGVLRFGHDGTNSSGGYIVPAGRKIRIPNVITQSATSATKTDNNLNTTLTSRYRVLCTSAGAVEVDRTTSAWNMSQFITGSTVSLVNSSFIGSVGGTGPYLSRMVMRNCGVGQPIASTAVVGSFSTILSGADITDCWFGQGVTSGRAMVSVATCNDFIFTRCYTNGTGDANNLQGFTTNICNNITLNDVVVHGSIQFNQTAGVRGTDLTWYTSAFGNGVSVTGSASLLFQSTTSDVIIDGLSTGGLVGQGSRTIFVSIAGSSSDILLKNFGTVSAPIDFRNADGYNYGLTWNRVTTVATITKTAHGLKVGDFITFNQSSDVSAITNGLKTVASVVDANNFTVACLNAGAASGTLGYYYSPVTNAVSIAAGSSNIRVQNFHVLGNSSGAQGFASLVSNNDITLENFTSDMNTSSPNTFLATNFIGESVSNVNSAFSATANQYGSSITSQYMLPYNTYVNVVGAAWTRSTNVITITKTDHGLNVGSRVALSDSSDPTATGWGVKAVSTVTSKDTFTVVGTAAGAASGTITYRIPDGRFQLTFNEGNDTLTPYTIDAGTDNGFTGAGTFVMPTVNNQVTWETQRFLLGYDSFPAVVPQLGGGSVANFEITYALDTGSGYGSFKHLSYPRLTGTGTVGTTDLDMASTTGVVVGEYVYGQGVADGAKVSSIFSATRVVVDIAHTGTVTGTLQFSELPTEGTIPSTGFKMKIRYKTIVANTEANTFLFIPATSTNTSRARLYPQAVETVSFSISNIPVGSIIALYDSAGVELQRENNVTTGLFTYDYIHSGVDFTDNYYVFWHADYYPFKSVPFDLTATDLGVSVVPQEDLAYNAAAANISTFDYPNKVHIQNPTVTSGGDVDIPLTSLYSNWKDDITLSDNFTYDFAYRVVGGEPTYSTNSISINVFQDNGWKQRPKEINHTGRITGGNLIPETGGAIIPTIGAYTALIEYQNPERSIAVTSGGLVTTVAEVADAVWDEAKSSHTTAGTFGRSVIDTEENADLAAFK